MTPLATLLTERARALEGHLEGAVRGEVRAVHQSRVVSRRLREALPVAGRGGGKAGRRARKTFRKITRALGPVRELDVALAHLDEGLGAGTDADRIPQIAVERVRAHLLAARERRRERMLAKLDRLDLEDAVAQVTRVAGASEGVTAFSAARLEKRIRRRAAALSAAIDEAGGEYDPERLHSVRIATKKLRYALEVAAATGDVGAAADSEWLGHVQGRLGLMHDYQVLLEHVAHVREEAARDTPGATGLKAMAAAYDRECRALHAEYLELATRLASLARGRSAGEHETGETTTDG